MVRAVLYTQPMAADEPTQRAAKSRVSSAARTKLNQRAMWQKCEAIMAANFDRHDLWVTLTYRDADLPHSREQAVRCLAWFIDELRRVRREKPGHGNTELLQRFIVPQLRAQLIAEGVVITGLVVDLL